jgi:hypothetical protein
MKEGGRTTIKLGWLSRLITIKASIAVRSPSLLTSRRLASTVCGRLPSSTPRTIWSLMALMTINASEGAMLPSRLISSHEKPPTVTAAVPYWIFPAAHWFVEPENQYLVDGKLISRIGRKHKRAGGGGAHGDAEDLVGTAAQLRGGRECPAFADQARYRGAAAAAIGIGAVVPNVACRDGQRTVPAYIEKGGKDAAREHTIVPSQNVQDEFLAGQEFGDGQAA